jgi:CheY-like chemotaxis protein/anti-sigma regulatory factor (Ser/Thr protein kinase)
MVTSLPSNIDTQDTKLALVVDDSKMQCMVLSVLLKEEGYSVITANDGASGVSMYIECKPDLVLMDINMPIMDGYKATRKIKSLSQNNLCPLIFITSMDTDKAYIESIEAGGDGILVRPFSPEVFKAKIKSIQRISDLYGQVKSLQQEQQKDAELAEQLMSGVIEARNFALDKIGIVKQAAALFSGDIQLTALCPNGNINVLLGDFTGHGLRSSIGAIPLAETFRAMTKKGFSLQEIIVQVNKQLYDLLPSDLFLGAAFVTLSEHDRSAYILNAGLPDAYIFDGEGNIKHKVASSHPPMGVLPELIPGSNLTVLSVDKNDHIALISDGIVEARNEQGEMFEFTRFEQSAKLGVLSQSISKQVFNDVMMFCQGMPQEDDISLIDIPCGGWETEQSSSENSLLSQKDKTDIELDNILPSLWKWQLTLSGSRLAKVNPIPMALSQIGELEGDSEHWQNLYTILTELFVNALDHGVLELSSKLKSSAEGFALYFKEREARLAKLNSGYVDIQLSYHSLENGGRIKIYITDSGDGFDFKAYRDNALSYDAEKQFSGRGILMLEQLCESLIYRENGTVVEASYVWNE